MNTPLLWWTELVTHNFWWKLLSVAMAAVLWALVASEPELNTLVTVPLEYKNLPDDLEISVEPVSAITLELRGPSGELRGPGGGSLHPAVILDMSGVQPGIHTFPIGDGNLKLSRGIRLVRANPSEVRFEFDRRMVRSVPVKVRVTGEGQNGYVVAGVTADPPELSVQGPAGKVSKIREVVTDPVDVSTVVGTSEFRVNAFVDDPYVRFRSSPQVRVTVNMKKK
jgi:hypothetical protein